MSSTMFVRGEILSEELDLDCATLVRCCQLQQEELIAMVDAGLLEPRGERPSAWRFSGLDLKRARVVQRLTQDLANKVWVVHSHQIHGCIEAHKDRQADDPQRDSLNRNKSHSSFDQCALRGPSCLPPQMGVVHPDESGVETLSTSSVYCCFKLSRTVALEL